jgi:hypothetical protein
MNDPGAADPRRCVALCVFARQNGGSARVACAPHGAELLRTLGVWRPVDLSAFTTSISPIAPGMCETVD